LNFFKEIKENSLLLDTKMHLIYSFLEGRLVYNPLFLFAGAILYNEEIRHEVQALTILPPLKIWFLHFWRSVYRKRGDLSTYKSFSEELDD
jgi:hypothetical protein